MRVSPYPQHPPAPQQSSRWACGAVSSLGDHDASADEEGACQHTLVFLPGRSHGQRSLAGLQSMGLQKVGHD